MNKPATSGQTPAANSNQPTPVERFTNEVLRQFGSTAGEVNVTEKQRRLIRSYFVRLDMVLQAAEKKRDAKKNGVSFTWENVNLKQLSIDVANFSLVGLDPVQKNHLNLIPHFETASGKYNITFITGFKGIEFKAVKYGLDVPKAVIVEVVHQNDEFKPIKKSGGGSGDTYEFNILKPFDRGEVVGGFYFHEFEDPTKNKLRIFSLHDIKKRIPKHASPEFWGGERNVWKSGQITGTEKVEGWFEEMVFKTIYRSAYDAITIDPDKIDEAFEKTFFAEQEGLLEPAKEQVEDVVHQEIKSEPVKIVIEAVTKPNEEPNPDPVAMKPNEEFDSKPADNLFAGKDPFE